jgi:cephalosporin hydroxylase
MTPLEQFKADINDRVGRYKGNASLQAAGRAFFEEIGIGGADYVYNFTWLGVPIIQLPQDLQLLQEIIWDVKPDLIIETGIAWGGTLLHSASMLTLLEACGVIRKGHVIGIDIDIRSHNKAAISQHPLSRKITTLEGSSIDEAIIGRVKDLAMEYTRIMVCLDSNHTHDHVLAELEAYAPLVSIGSYCMVGDTIIEDAPDSMVSQRPWCKGNSPKTAVWEYLRLLNDQGRTGMDGNRLNFEIDKLVEDKVIVTGSPDGFLKRIE